jgi:hypothetical protein
VICKQNFGNMKQEDKELLLKDLCARLPYGVKCKTLTQDMNGNDIVYEDKEELTIYRVRRLGNEYMTVIPYLFPMSSMTVKQRDSYRFLTSSAHASPVGLIDFFHKNHIDYRGLIPKGLAIDATGLNIY